MLLLYSGVPALKKPVPTGTVVCDLRKYFLDNIRKVLIRRDDANKKKKKDLK